MNRICQFFYPLFISMQMCMFCPVYLPRVVSLKAMSIRTQERPAPHTHPVRCPVQPQSDRLAAKHVLTCCAWPRSAFQQGRHAVFTTLTCVQMWLEWWEWSSFSASGGFCGILHENTVFYANWCKREDRSERSNVDESCLPWRRPHVLLCISFLKWCFSFISEPFLYS